LRVLEIYMVNLRSPFYRFLYQNQTPEIFCLSFDLSSFFTLTHDNYKRWSPWIKHAVDEWWREGESLSPIHAFWNGSKYRVEIMDQSCYFPESVQIALGVALIWTVPSSMLLMDGSVPQVGKIRASVARAWQRL